MSLNGTLAAIDRYPVKGLTAQALTRARLIAGDREVVENGVDAVSEVATGMFDLVLMDMMMPGVDGLAATRAIRRLNGAQSGTYIIAVTANASVEDRNKCLAAGMDDHMAKPITVERLGNVLDRYMSRRSGRPSSNRH